MEIARFGCDCLAVFRLPKRRSNPIWPVDSMACEKISKGKGGILKVFPFHESGKIEEVWRFGDHLESLTKVRELLIRGDLRALYLLWLCAAYDDNEDPAEMIEPPVPHGLEKIPASSVDLLPFFGLDPLTLKAAAVGVPGFAIKTDDEDPTQEWSRSISEARSRTLLRRLLKEDPASLKAELLAEIRDRPFIGPRRCEVARSMSCILRRVNCENRRTKLKIRRNA